MLSTRILAIVGATFVAVFGFVTGAAPAVAASSEKVLYDFCSVPNCTDGSTPRA
jgi:hypothetical protein